MNGARRAQSEEGGRVPAAQPDGAGSVIVRRRANHAAPLPPPSHCAFAPRWWPIAQHKGRVPPGIICPLSMDIMDDPVVTEDGHSFNRPARGPPPHPCAGALNPRCRSSSSGWPTRTCRPSPGRCIAPPAASPTRSAAHRPSPPQPLRTKRLYPNVAVREVVAAYRAGRPAVRAADPAAGCAEAIAAEPTFQQLSRESAMPADEEQSLRRALAAAVAEESAAPRSGGVHHARRCARRAPADRRCAARKKGSSRSSAAARTQAARRALLPYDLRRVRACQTGGAPGKACSRWRCRLTWASGGSSSAASPRSRWPCVQPSGRWRRTSRTFARRPRVCWR